MHTAKTVIGVLAAVFLLLTARAESSEWASGQSYDDIADETRFIAAVTVDDGHSFGLYQIEGDSGLWIMLLTPENSRVSADQFPIIRVDDEDPINTQDLVVLEELGGGRYYHFAPNAFYSYFSTTDGIHSGTHFVYDLMVGSLVKVRYWRPDGSAVRVEFPLTGSRAAISQALGLESIPSRAEARRNQLAQEITGKAMMECASRHSPHLEGVENPNQAALELCLETTTACGEITADDPVQFYDCFDQHVEIYQFCAAYSEARRNSPGVAETCIELKLNQTYPNYAPYAIN